MQQGHKQCIYAIPKQAGPEATVSIFSCSSSAIATLAAHQDGVLGFAKRGVHVDSGSNGSDNVLMSTITNDSDISWTWWQTGHILSTNGNASLWLEDKNGMIRCSHCMKLYMSTGLECEDRVS